MRSKDGFGPVYIIVASFSLGVMRTGEKKSASREERGATGRARRLSSA
jgi:hypothetical protein